VAKGADEAQRAVVNGTLTAKIKAKMALDDRVKAANIDVDTTGSVVTLTGRVSSDEERRRAVQLARETDGVTSVIDRLAVR
jgi:hyperosmotically inducible protein